MIPNRPTPPLPPASREAAFRWLPTGREALDDMLACIGEARHSLLLEIYIFDADSVGERFLAALVAARRRGVRVQVLVDAVGSITLPTSFWVPLIQEGGEFRWFNPFRAKERYGCRNHRKLLVADHRIAFIGGFNIAEAYYGDGVSSGWRDLGMEVRGPVVDALEATFQDLFAKADSRPLSFPSLRRMPETEVAGDPWTLLLSGPGRGHHALKRWLIRDLSRASRVQIICAYFVPTWRIRRALMRVARRGGSVELILAGKSDVRLSQMASRSLYTKLMRAGVRIYEYQPQILHAKLFAIDDVVYVGSANLDARSLKLNYELLLRVADARVAKEGQAIFEADLAHSERIELAKWRASRNWWTRMTQRVAYALLVQLDPYITNLRWRNQAARALRKLEG